MQQLKAPAGGLTSRVDIVPGGTNGIFVQSGVGANTKGAWVELIASTPYKANGLRFQARSNNFLGTSVVHLMDIAIGAPASEVIIVENIFVNSFSSGSSNINLFTDLDLPIEIPAGVRIAARSQSQPGNITSSVFASLKTSAGQSANITPTGKVETYGALPGVTGGVPIDPGGATNTKGGWIEIGTAGSNGLRQLLFCIGSKLASRQFQTTSWFLDIGYGPVASEIVVIPDYALHCGQDIGLLHPVSSAKFDVSIPPGARIVARAQSNTADFTLRQFDCIIYGVA